MLGKKGQEAAPFELLIAVILMGFVLLAGVSVMNVLREEECKGRLDNQLEEIKTAIERIASGDMKASFSFSLPDCFERGIDNSGNLSSKLRVITKSDRQFCNAVCLDARIECKILSFTTTDHHNAKCLEISTATNFPDDAELCNDFEDSPGGLIYVPRDLESSNGIEEGQYLLIMKYDLQRETPDMCAYKKVI